MWISFALLVSSENWMLSAWVMVRPIDERNVAPTVKSSKNGPSTAAIVPRGRALGGVPRSLFRQAAERGSHFADAGVYLTMAVRAEHHAFLELGNDPLPGTRQTVGTDTERLLPCVPVMELEQRGRSSAFAGVTHGTNE